MDGYDLRGLSPAQLSQILGNAASASYHDYDETGSIEDLNKAVSYAREGVRYATIANSYVGIHLSNLGSYLDSRHKRTGREDDLEEAMGCVERAVSLFPGSDPRRPVSMLTLSNLLGNRYERLGNDSDLEKGIALLREAIQLLPNAESARSLVSRPDEGRPLRATFLANLGLWTLRRFERKGTVQDLHESVRVTRQALALTTRENAERGQVMSDLSCRLGSLYIRTGDAGALQEAVELIQHAVQLTPPTNPRRANLLNNLANRLADRYELTGENSDLVGAIGVARQALHATSSDHPDKASRHSNLGGLYRRQYERSGKTEHLDTAIQGAQQALELTPKDHPERSTWLNMLSSRLRERYWVTQDGKILEEAAELDMEALKLIPLNHPDRAALYSSAGATRFAIHLRFGALKSLLDAVTYTKQALELTDLDSPSVCTYNFSLGIQFLSRHARNGKEAVLQQAAEYFSSSFYCQSGTPVERMKAAAWCLQCKALLGMTEGAIKIGEEAFGMLPTIQPRSLSQNDQLFVLRKFGGLAADYCAYLLAANRVEAAVECLEQGRAVMISRMLEGRADLSDLRQSDVELAKRYEQLENEVNQTVDRDLNDVTQRDKFIRRRAAVTELEGCIEEIRKLPGFTRFLLGQTVAEMQESMSHGHVVFVNVSAARCDAIVLSKHSLKAIHLPTMKYAAVQAWNRQTWRAKKRSEQRQKNEHFARYLQWLWHCCVKLVLDEILDSLSGDEKPHIWWIGCGLASSMPFHAAGLHAYNSKENAFNYAVSSYTPSIRALNHSRQQLLASKKMTNTQSGMIIATMPTTPAAKGQQKSPGALPGVSEERRQVSTLVPSTIPLSTLDHPSAADVLDKLSRCQIAHLACHGVTNSADVLGSGLILQKPSLMAVQGPEQDYLSVYRISELKLKNARLAYLSACSTAENVQSKDTWSKGVQDEVVHIVSGFQLAGFASVVGTLWPAGDRECVEIARGFYSRFFQRETDADDVDSHVAECLREAVMDARRREPESPLLWAQFVHFGA